MKFLQESLELERSPSSCMLIKEGGDMEGLFLKRFFRRIFWGALIILFLVPPSFSQTPAGKNGPLTIQKIEVTETSKGFQVMIEGSRPFEYSAFRLEKPLRVVVEVPHAQLGKLAGPMEIKNGMIDVIRNIQVEDPLKLGARVEIGLDQKMDYNLVSEGNLLYVELPRPSIIATPKSEEKVALAEPPARAAKSLKELEISAKTDWVRVGIRGDGMMPDYQSFQLTKPPRLILDFPRMTNAYPRRNIDVGSKFLKNIRIGQHPNKLRLVFTFPEARIPPLQITREGQELALLLGRAQEELPKKEKPPVAEIAKPVRVSGAVSKTEEEPTAEAKRPEAAAPVAAEKAAAQEKEPRAEVKATPEVKPALEPKPAAEVKAAEPEKTPITRYTGAKLSLDFKEADIHNIFRLIAEVSNLNIITTEDVKGKITIRMVNVPWDQALDVILASKNLIKIEEGNVLRITTIENVRKEMEEKAKEEANLLKSMENRENAEELITEIFRLNYAKAADLQKVISGAGMTGGSAGGMKPILSSRGSVRSDDRTNTLIVRDIRARFEEIQNLIKKLDSPTPQVLIEARVVQAQTSFVRSLGIQWGGSYNQTSSNSWFWGLTGNNPNAVPGWGFSPTTSTPLSMPSNFVVNFPASIVNTPVGGAAMSFGKLTGGLVNLDLRLQLGETDNRTKVIARPKLATLDNKEAHIKQGEKIPYETTSQAGTQVQFIDAVLSLRVTPHVTPDGSILMKVMVTRDSRGATRSPINQVPSIDNREASTEVLVKDGETLVIGGIYESDTNETEQGIPWLMKIPILGWLFKNQETLITKRELLIFITPTIITQAKAET